MRKVLMAITRTSRKEALLALLLLTGQRALAQIGPPASGQSQGTQANPLPLSGRTAQSGSVATGQAPVPGTTTSVNTINPTIDIQGPFNGSARSTGKMPFTGKLSLREALERGLAYNLGGVGSSQAVRQAHGQSRAVRSALLPNLNGTANETVEQINLRAAGIRIRSQGPGPAIPDIVGPFSFVDLRVRLSQTVADLSAWNNYRASQDIVRASQFAAQDARDLIVLVVGGTYLQAVAATARVDSQRAQLETATALLKQTTQKREAGLLAQIDVNRNEVQTLTQQQRLISLQNDLAKQKIRLARLTGLPPNDQYEIVDLVPFAAAPGIPIESALKQAFERREDLKASRTQVRAAEHARSAARDERLPSLALNADYGAIGLNPSQLHGTFSASGTLRVPLWQGGRAAGDMEQANAVLQQRRAELEDLTGQIEAEVRDAYLDLQAATSQVELSQKNLATTQQNLTLTRQRFEEGVTDSVEVVQSQESVAAAHLDYINSVFAHNVAKLSVARAMGGAIESLPQYLNLP